MSCMCECMCVCLHVHMYMHMHMIGLHVYTVYYYIPCKYVCIHIIHTHTHTLTHTSTFIYVCSLYCIIMYYTSAMTFKTNVLTYPQQLSSASNQEPISIRVPPVSCADHNPKSCRNISWYHLSMISVIKIGYPKEITCFIILHTNNDQAICAPIATSWGFLEILGFEFEKETANAAGSLEVWYWLAGTNLRITGHIDSRNRWRLKATPQNCPPVGCDHSSPLRM